MNVPRFVKEFSNYQIKLYSNNKLMLPELKQEAINTINKAIFNYTRGYITIHETMQIINNPLYNHTETFESDIYDFS